jgi:hypothetical protein
LLFSKCALMPVKIFLAIGTKSANRSPKGFVMEAGIGDPRRFGDECVRHHNPWLRADVFRMSEAQALLSSPTSKGRSTGEADSAVTVRDCSTTLAHRVPRDTPLRDEPGKDVTRSDAVFLAGAARFA